MSSLGAGGERGGKSSTVQYMNNDSNHHHRPLASSSSASANLKLRTDLLRAADQTASAEISREIKEAARLAATAKTRNSSGGGGGGNVGTTTTTTTTRYSYGFDEKPANAATATAAAEADAALQKLASQERVLRSVEESLARSRRSSLEPPQIQQRQQQLPTLT